MLSIVVITGRIGSGKSTITDMLKYHGYQTIKIDDFAKCLYVDYEFKFLVLKYFGPEAIGTDDSINIPYFREQLFSPGNEEYRKAIEDYIFRKFIEHLSQVPLFKCPLFVEIPEIIRFKEYITKLNEQFSSKPYEYKIVVRTKDERKRYSRVFQRSGLSYEQISNVDNLQCDLPLNSEDILLENDGSLNDLEKAVEYMIVNIIELKHKLH